MSDAEADIYEYLHSAQRQGHGFVIRAGQDRALVATGGLGAVGRLHATVRQAPPLGQCTVEVYPRPGQAARTATLRIGAVAVRLRAPQRPGASAGQLPPIACTAVRVWEATPCRGPNRWNGYSCAIRQRPPMIGRANVHCTRPTGGWWRIFIKP